MSVNTIVINGQSCVDSNSNAKYKYSFQKPQYFKRNDQVALNLANIFYSWKNISSTNYNNNSFQYQWYSTANTTSMDTFTVTLPDAYMSVNDINEYLIAYMTTKGHYTYTSANGVTTKKYYINISENSNYYAVQLDTTILPTDMSGISIPTISGASWKYPSSNKTPTVIINSTNNFGSLIGFKSGSYPPTTKTSNYTVLSTLTPNMNPVSSVLMCCNLIRNDYSIPNNVLYSFTSFGTTYGDMISVVANEKTYINIVEGTYTSIDITFYDQNLNLLPIVDTDLMIMLNIKNN